MMEGWFFQAIQHKTSTETGIEQGVQGTIEGVVRGGLAKHADTFLRARVQVLCDLDGEGRDNFTVDVVGLGTERHAGVVEARVSEGKDKAASRFNDLANATQQWVDLGYIHDCHVADSGIEALLPESNYLLLVCGIEEVVVNTVSMFGSAGARSFEELRTEISGDNVDPKLGHTAGEDAIATSYLQHHFARLQVEQTLSRRTDEEAMEVVAIAHSLVPE